MKLFFFLFLVAGAPSLSFSQTATGEFRVVGYYSMEAATAMRDNVPFKRLTHLNLWFLNPDSAGHFADVSALRPFVEKAHRKKVKVLFSMGGGSKQKQYLQLLRDESRTMLINNVMTVVETSGVDGIDVDLEGSDIDSNYEKFVTELAARLRAKGKIITAALAVYLEDQLPDAALAQYDFVNIMSYDHTGPWSPQRPGPHSTYEQAVEDLRFFHEERKIPKEKMTLGVPFYGYGFGPDLTSKAVSMNYRQIIQSYPDAGKTDQWEMTPGQIIYYNGLATIKRKTTLAKEKASGIMIWQIRGDAKGKKSLLRLIHKSK